MRRRRMGWIARACGLAVALSGIAVIAPAQPSGVRAAAATGAAEIRIATFNVKYDLTREQALADITKLASTNVDVIALQEMGTRLRRDDVRAQLACDTCPWDSYMPLTGAKAAEPILFRRDRFTAEDSGSRKVSEETYVGPEGAGPSTLKAKFIGWVRLYDAVANQHVYILNNHAVPSVQAKDGGPNYRLPARLELYKQHMAGLKTFITELTGTGAAVFVTGDFNVNYRTDRKVQASIFPYSSMGSVRTWASYRSLGEPATGTHVLPNGFDKRLIDYVFYLRDSLATPKDQWILRGYLSDHRPLVTLYGLATSDLPHNDGPEAPPATVPDAPTGVAGTGGDKQATITWTAPADNGAPITGYRVTASPDGTSVTVSGSSTSALMTGLTNGRRYTFTVVATNAEGDSAPSPPSAVVVPATTPRRMAAPTVKVRYKRAIITWTAPRTGGSPILAYRVLVNDRVFKTGPDSRRIVVRKLRRGRYSARVSARNAIGYSTPSEPTRFRIRR